MFGSLTEKFQNLFLALSKSKTFTDDNMQDAIRHVRLALLDADVNYSVASQFVKRVKEKIVGQEIIKSVSVQDQFSKIIHDELVELMGKEEPKLHSGGRPTVIMMCGLQASGKTTQTAKLAHFLQKPGSDKKVLLAACDLQRPAAVEQLKVLGTQSGTDVYSIDGSKDPVRVAKEAVAKASKEGYDVVILDTAGRLHIDDQLMKELEQIKKATSPHEILFVASAATGQDAVKTASEFDARVSITGTILTMLDGNTRAGAAISITDVTKKPLKFEGVGEKLEDLQLFNPVSMADRILGMGDVINLVKKAQEHIDEKESEELEKKIRKASFTYDDYLKQMKMVKKMGSFKSLLKMMPGMSQLGDLDFDEKEFTRLESMILSMTPNERIGKDELEHARRRRIATGSGVHVDDVNRMVKGFKRIRQMMKKMPGMKNKLLKDPSFKDILSGKM